mmetsp:Transcript_23865/g.50646  ORF Transcript_23865/g.50646 Transcript_23865/m.50646 type:complete len:433 (-) Transcript_23865:744-2042(-)
MSVRMWDHCRNGLSHDEPQRLNTRPSSLGASGTLENGHLSVLIALLDHRLDVIEAVRIVRDGLRVTILFEHLAVLKPLFGSGIEDLPKRVGLPLLLTLDGPAGSLILCQGPWQDRADHHHHRGTQLRVDDVSRDVILGVGLVSGNHAASGGHHVLEVQGEVKHVAEPVVRLPSTRRVGGAAETLRVHLRELGEVVPAVIAIDPEALHFLQPHELVHRPLANEAKELEDGFDALDLPPRVHVDGALRQPLHSAYHDLASTEVAREEVNVADTESRLLVDGDGAAVAVRLHCVVRPRVVTDHVIYLLHVPHDHGSREGEGGAVDLPRHNPRHGKVLPACDQVDLLCLILAATADILHRKGAEATDGYGVASDRGIVRLGEHAIAHRAAEEILALVLLTAGIRQITGEVAKGGTHEVLLVSSDLVLEGEVVVLLL